MKTRRGVTMLEVLVASLMMGLALVAGIELVARSAAVSRGVEERTRALIFCRGKLEEIIKEPVLSTGDERGEGADSRYDYDWQAVIEQAPGELNLMLVTVEATNRKSGLSARISTLRRPDLSSPPEGAAVAGAAPAAAPPPAEGTL